MILGSKGFLWVRESRLVTFVEVFVRVVWIVAILKAWYERKCHISPCLTTLTYPPEAYYNVFILFMLLRPFFSPFSAFKGIIRFPCINPPFLYVSDVATQPFHRSSRGGEERVSIRASRGWHICWIVDCSRRTRRSMRGYENVTRCFIDDSCKIQHRLSILNRKGLKSHQTEIFDHRDNCHIQSNEARWEGCVESVLEIWKVLYFRVEVQIEVYPSDGQQIIDLWKSDRYLVHHIELIDLFWTGHWCEGVQAEALLWVRVGGRKYILRRLWYNEHRIGERRPTTFHQRLQTKKKGGHTLYKHFFEILSRMFFKLSWFVLNSTWPGRSNMTYASFPRSRSRSSSQSKFFSRYSMQ